MRRDQVALVAVLAVVVVVIWAAVWRTVAPAFADASASPSNTSSASTTPSASPSDPPSPTATEALTPTAAPTPTATPARTPAPTSEVDPRVAWVAFLAHLDDIRPEAAALTDDLVAAAQAGDDAGVRDAATDILRLADRERDWLAANPPAACYAGAHAASGDLIDAYAEVAERAIDWADADGLDAIGALADLLAAAGDARDAVTSLTRAIEAATCLG